MSLQFFAFEKPHDQPSGSGYCQKLETHLRIANFQNYEMKWTMPFSAPKGKLPYITYDGETVADSHFIIRHLVQTRAVRDLDEGLSPAQRAESRAWQAYIEELVYPAVLQIRSIPENFEELKKEIFDWVPWVIRPFLAWWARRTILTNLRGHGVGRHTTAEVNSILQEFVTSLTAALEAKIGPSQPFFHGKEPTAIDAVIYGFLTNALGTLSNPSYSSLILESSTLRNYIARNTKLWFPEYRRILEMVE